MRGFPQPQLWNREKESVSDLFPLENLAFAQVLSSLVPILARFNNIFTIFFLDTGQVRPAVLGMAWLLL